MTEAQFVAIKQAVQIQRHGIWTGNQLLDRITQLERALIPAWEFIEMAQKRHWEQVHSFAQKVVAEMAPYCERIEIAGSLRRRAEFVKDVEIVCVPKTQTVPDGLFGTRERNCLHDWALQVAEARRLRWIKPGCADVIDWPPKEDAKYWRGYHDQSDLKLDIYMVTPQTWGCLLLIRTGPAEYGTELVNAHKDRGFSFSSGRLWRDNTALDTPEEADVYQALGLEWIEPAERI